MTDTVTAESIIFITWAFYTTRIYYFPIEVAPTPESSNFREAGGAFVNCWIKSTAETSARVIAQSAIQNDGWDIIKVDETYVAERERYLDFPDSLELFDQADREGEAYLFNTWPPEPQDGDIIH